MPNLGDLFRDLGFDVPEKKPEPPKRKPDVHPANEIYLPNDTAGLMQSSVGETCDNLALGLNKLKLLKQIRRDKKTEQITSWKFGFPDRDQRVAIPGKTAELLREINKANDALPHTSSLPLTTASRIVVGLGGATVYETGMTMHHIYGVPYIPGSSVKGVCRHWVVQEYFENDENYALKCKKFRTAFGFQQGEEGARGNVIFFDAFPVKLRGLERDIMNPHFGNYYKNAGKPSKNSMNLPTDDMSPVPIFFLAVPAQTNFQFYLQNGELELRGKSVKDHLRDALTESGIGAKTALGYGLFKE
ncbi:MAG: type III-B CRISPR module RAMP protein Cmr6 [Oscillospiraceae bacterium]|jgi:CRISPR-associated protein Cmr6|nr:type III-B CRISPR module RAMP protein Cmr6 [Oscillospiraceae bacterium]